MSKFPPSATTEDETDAASATPPQSTLSQDIVSNIAEPTQDEEEEEVISVTPPPRSTLSQDIVANMGEPTQEEEEVLSVTPPPRSTLSQDIVANMGEPTQDEEEEEVVLVTPPLRSTLSQNIIESMAETQLESEQLNIPPSTLVSDTSRAASPPSPPKLTDSVVGSPAILAPRVVRPSPPVTPSSSATRPESTLTRLLQKTGVELRKEETEKAKAKPLQQKQEQQQTQEGGEESDEDILGEIKVSALNLDEVRKAAEKRKVNAEIRKKALEEGRKQFNRLARLAAGIDQKKSSSSETGTLVRTGTLPIEVPSSSSASTLPPPIESQKSSGSEISRTSPTLDLRSRPISKATSSPLINRLVPVAGLPRQPSVRSERSANSPVIPLQRVTFAPNPPPPPPPPQQENVEEEKIQEENVEEQKIQEENVDEQLPLDEHQQIFEEGNEFDGNPPESSSSSESSTDERSSPASDSADNTQNNENDEIPSPVLPARRAPSLRREQTIPRVQSIADTNLGRGRMPDPVDGEERLYQGAVGAFEGNTRIYADSTNSRVMGMINGIRRAMLRISDINDTPKKLEELQDQCLKLLKQPRNIESNQQNIASICQASVTSSAVLTRQTISALIGKISELQKQINAVIEVANAKTPMYDPCEDEKDCLSKKLAELETVLKTKMDELTNSLVNSFKFLPVGTPVDPFFMTKCTLPLDENVRNNIFLKEFWDVFYIDASLDFNSILVGFAEVFEHNRQFRVTIDENTPFLSVRTEQERIIQKLRNKTLGNHTIFDWIATVVHQKDKLRDEQNDVLNELQIYMRGLDQLDRRNIKLIWNELVKEITLLKLSRYVIGGGLENVMLLTYFNRKADDYVDTMIDNHIREYTVIHQIGPNTIDYIELLDSIGAPLPPPGTQEDTDRYIREKLLEYYQDERNNKIQAFLSKKNTRNLFRTLIQQELIEIEKTRLLGIHLKNLNDDNILEVIQVLNNFQQEDLAASHETILNRLTDFLNDRDATGKNEVYNKFMLRFLYERESRIFFEDDDVIGPTYLNFFQKIGRVEVQIGGERVEWKHREDHLLEEDPLYSAYVTLFEFVLSVPEVGDGYTYQEGFIVLYYFWFCLSQENHFELIKILFESSKVTNKQLLCSILASIDEDDMIEKVIDKAPAGSLAHKMVILRKFSEIQSRIPGWAKLFEGKELAVDYKTKLPMIKCSDYLYNLMDTIENTVDLYPNGIAVHVCPFHEIDILSGIHGFKIPCEIVTLTRKGYSSKVYKLIKV